MTKRRLSIDVEPLSERRWAEIERDVLERVDAQHAPLPQPERQHRRPPVRVASAVLAAAAAIALAWWARPSGPPGVTLASSRVVTAGDTTETTAGDVSIEVAPRSSVLVLEREPDAWLVSIEHGEARFRVPRRAGRPPFAVEAGLVRVEVIGTRFSVARAAGTSTATVVVGEGTVRVVARGEETLVHAGERWPEAEPSAARQEAAREEEGASEAPAAIAVDEGSSIDTTPDVARRARRASRVAPAIASDPSDAEPASAELEDERPAAASTPSRPVAPAQPTPRERFARAEALERSDPTTALAEYAALARAGGGWGANALFAQGRLELDLGHRERARALLQRYLAEHPDGLNAEDARTLLERSR